MNEKEYIKQRLDDQIRWYGQKSRHNQHWHKRLRMTEVTAAAIIPFVAGLGEVVPYNSIIVGLLGVIIAACVGASVINKYQENWLTYRTIAETLKHEKYLYLTSSSPYTGDERFTQFVERIEALISKENSQWSRHFKEKNSP